MNQLKRVFTAFFCFTFVLGTVGCGQKEQSVLDPENPVTITMWHYYNGTQLVAFERMVEEFNQTEGKSQGIYLEAFSQGDVNSLAALVLDSANGVVGVEQLPAIFAAYPDTAYEVKKLGLTVDLSTYLSEEELSEYMESFLNEGKLPPDNVQTIFPIAKSTELLYIEAFAWEELKEAWAGNPDYPVLEDQSLETVEGIYAVSEAYYHYTDAMTPDVPYDGKSFFGVDSIANFIYMMLYQQGYEFASMEDGNLAFHLNKEAMKNIWDYYYVPMVKGYYGQSSRYRSDDTKTGHILAYVGSSTGSAYFPNIITYPDGTQAEADIKVAQMPTIGSGKKAAIQQGAGLVVTKSDLQHEYAAVEFLKWFTQSSRNIEFSIASAYLPVKKEALAGEEIRNELNELQDSDDYAMCYTAQVFDLVLDQLETYELYFVIPYTDGLTMRNVLDDFASQAVNARESLLDRAFNGEGYDLVLEELISESAFDQWYQSLSDTCAAILAAQD